MKLFTMLTAVGLLLSITLLGCGASSDTTPPQQVQQNVSNDDNESAPLQYPELYTNEKLPQYAEATIVSTGRQVTSLRDGIRLELQSAHPVQTIAKFYEQELKEAGWQVPEPKLRNETMFMAVCTKAKLKYHVTITKMPNGKPTKIDINFVSE